MSRNLPNQVLIIIIVLILILGLASAFYLQSIFYPKALGVADFKNGPVTSTPASLTLEITSPDDNLLTFDESLIVGGKTLPKVQILVSTDTADSVVSAKTDGSFSADLALTSGVNEISIIVFDETGDQRELKRTVYYSKEKI